jgi:hypothetical protein
MFQVETKAVDEHMTPRNTALGANSLLVLVEVVCFFLSSSVMTSITIIGHQCLQIHETGHAIKQSAKIHYIQEALNIINQKEL